MFLIAFGVACLIALVFVVARPRRYRYRRVGSGILYRILERLGTSPGQEKVIRDSLETLRDQAWSFKDQLKASRSDLAEAIRAEYFDPNRVEVALATQAEQFDALKAEALAALGRIHETLDDRQRRRLAELIEQGPGFGWQRHAGC